MNFFRRALILWQNFELVISHFITKLSCFGENHCVVIDRIDFFCHLSVDI